MPHPQGENLNLESKSCHVDGVTGGGAIDAIDEEKFYKDLRRLQQRTLCTEKTVLDFISTFEKYSNCPVNSSLRACDKKMQVKFEFFVSLIQFHTSHLLYILSQAKAGVMFLALNGCTGCNKFVYLPSDKRKNCPHVKANGEVCGEPRFGANGQPKEVRLKLFVFVCCACMIESLKFTYLLFIQRVFLFRSFLFSVEAKTECTFENQTSFVFV